MCSFIRKRKEVWQAAPILCLSKIHLELQLQYHCLLSAVPKSDSESTWGPRSNTPLTAPPRTPDARPQTGTFILCPRWRWSPSAQGDGCSTGLLSTGPKDKHVLCGACGSDPRGTGTIPRP